MMDLDNITEPHPAPEIFVEGFTCASTANGVTKLAFFSVAHTSGEAEPERRIVARLTMPLGALVGAHEAMGRLIQQLKDQGALIAQSEKN
jgi:hypothetical protein